ncbi:MAG: CoA transferase, partial [Chloroflexota bacterium]|nr:CoA transferase [Chloroflexota bacterium]
MAKLPLEGVRVVAIHLVWALPYACQLLADFGAEVIWVESLQHFPRATRGLMARPPKELVPMLGSIGRGFPDMDPGERPWNRVAAFNIHMRNKHSCTMDLTRPKGMEMFKRLISTADVFVENNAVGRMPKLGITYESLKEVKPDIIMLSAPGYGNTGPYNKYVGYGFNVECVSGFTSLRGYPEDAPTTCSSTFWMDATSGAAMPFAVMSALHYRKRTGKGQFIDFSQSENLMQWYGESIMDYTANGRVQGTLGNRHTSAVQGCYPCQPSPRRIRPEVFAPKDFADDQWINISIFNDEQWQGLCRAMGNPEWTKDDKFADALSLYKNHDELNKHIAAWTRTQDKYDAFRILQKEGVPSGPVLDDKDVFADPHVKERGFFQEINAPECGTHLYPGLAWKMSKTPGSIRKPPVRVGEDNEYVYKKIMGVSEAEYEEMAKEQHIGMDFIG